MDVYLKEIKTKRALNHFIRFPLHLYKDNPYYVPAIYRDEVNTFDRKKNPAFDHCEARCWLAYKNNRIVGRIAAIYNRKHVEKWHQTYMRFSWYDVVDELSVSRALLGAVENWAAEKGLAAVHGPLGFSNFDREGLLIDGFDQLGTMATQFNYPYYKHHLEELGYNKDIDYVEYLIKIPDKLDPRISKAAQIVLKRNKLTMPMIRNKKELLFYAPQIFRLINSEYSQLYGTAPFSNREVDHYVDTFFNFIKPEYVPIILDEHQQVVAFGFTVPSLSHALQKCRGRILPFGWWHLYKAMRKNDLADLYLVAVKKKYQGLGVNMVLMEQVYRVFTRNGIKFVESNPEMETNLNVQSQWKIFDRKQHKRRRCLIKFI